MGRSTTKVHAAVMLSFATPQYEPAAHRCTETAFSCRHETYFHKGVFPYRMQPSKFVVKCGNFAVLVDLHILPLGSQDNSSRFSQENKEEVGALIKDVIEQRVRRFPEARLGPSKHRKELSPDNPLCLKGQTLRLAAYFMKRHVNLRCIITKHCRDLRIFPERLVVCVSLLKSTMAPTGNLNLDMTNMCPKKDIAEKQKRKTCPRDRVKTLQSPWPVLMTTPNISKLIQMEQSGQNKSEYFSGPRETLNLLNSSTITKKAALQKIARGREANTQPRPEPEHNLQSLDQDQGRAAMLYQPPSSDVAERACTVDILSPSESVALTQDRAVEGSTQGAHEGGEMNAAALLSKVSGSGQVDKDRRHWKTKECPEQREKDQTSQYSTGDSKTINRRRRRVLISPREDFDHQKPKRVRLRENTIATSLNFTTGPSPSHPAAAEVERVLEEELLTHGKQALSLPLRNGTAEQTNQSRLATSLRGLSVKAVSSGSSISSRLAAKVEERVSAPRISRLRRLKKS
ncbi:protein SLX4IP [Brachyhypopomus gauderio]|uniref:protein SLX4IP n=1 Tax=Brachyhypopomus gauderio TaxID=698409 RepID=UPI004041B167